jgi:hypothetical protein
LQIDLFIVLKFVSELRKLARNYGPRCGSENLDKMPLLIRLGGTRYHSENLALPAIPSLPGNFFYLDTIKEISYKQNLCSR